MNNGSIRFFGAMVLVLVGMAGLYFGIDYSGWVLFAGLFGVFFA
jgi:hypothetical protein